MTRKWEKALCAIILYCIAARLAYFSYLLFPNSLISPSVLMYVFEWPFVAIMGIFALILRKARIIKENGHSLYILLGVANACNAAIGVYLVCQGNSHANMLTIWLQLVATAVIAFLILIDAFL